MKETTLEILKETIRNYPVLEGCKADIQTSFDIIADGYRKGGKLMICGNGGSFSDSQHIVGELMKNFRKKRKICAELAEKLTMYGEDGKFLSEKLEGGLYAVALGTQGSFFTAYQNDNTAELVYAQEVGAIGKAGDTLMCLSTSGNSKNCVYAAMIAKALGINVISLTGKKDSRLSVISDATVKAPETETYKVQEYHLPIYHCLCAMLEEELF